MWILIILLNNTNGLVVVTMHLNGYYCNSIVIIFEGEQHGLNQPHSDNDLSCLADNTDLVI